MGALLHAGGRGARLSRTTASSSSVNCINPLPGLVCMPMQVAEAVLLLCVAQPHSCNTGSCVLTLCADLRCVLQPVYGFNSKDPAKFLRVAPNSELMYVQDPEVSFNQVQCAGLGCMVDAWGRPAAAESQNGLLPVTTRHAQECVAAVCSSPEQQHRDSSCCSGTA